MGNHSQKKNTGDKSTFGYFPIYLLGMGGLVLAITALLGEPSTKYEPDKRDLILEAGDPIEIKPIAPEIEIPVVVEPAPVIEDIKPDPSEAQGSVLETPDEIEAVVVDPPEPVVPDPIVIVEPEITLEEIIVTEQSKPQPPVALPKKKEKVCVPTRKPIQSTQEIFHENLIRGK